MSLKPCPVCQSTTHYGIKGDPQGPGWLGCTDCLVWRPQWSGDVTTWKRNLRLSKDRARFAKDTTPPHIYDKLKRTTVPNPEFVKQYPQKAREWYRPQELKQAGYGRLAEKVQKQRDADGVSRDLGGAL